MNDQPTSPLGGDGIDKIEPGQSESVVFAGQGSKVEASPETPVKADADPDVLAAFWEAVKRLPAYGRLSYAIARDPKVPNQAKGLLAAGGIYLVSPIDLIPGVIPVVGQLDDLYVLLTALQYAVKNCPAEIIAPHLTSAGVTQKQIEDDLASIRHLVRFAVVKGWKLGSRAIARAGGNVTARFRKAAQREKANDDQKPI
ncbi:MAG TPA: YkvA family protein [Thermomicrobiales bacterium]|nr:YkvA family protein [Thermomicrobiales bacterium]